MRVEFTITDVDLSVVNSLRRIILAEIPTVAFHFDTYDQDNKDIIVHSNTGVLHNEFLSHRLSLIPLNFSADEIENFDEKKYKFVLKRKNIGTEPLLVTTRDFEIYDAATDTKMPENFREHIFPKCPITKDYILITKLRPNLYNQEYGEEIDIEAWARIGIAATHARWCAVSQCSYYNAVDETAAARALEELLRGKTPEEAKSIKSKFQVMEKYRYFKKNKYDEPNEFVFIIESECRLTPAQIFSKAKQILLDKVRAFARIVPELQVQAIGPPGLYQVEIKNETYTLVNMLQSLIYNKCFRESDNPLSYIGYYQSHPLDNIMYLKMKFIEPNTDVQEFLVKQCAHISDYIAKNIQEII